MSIKWCVCVLAVVWGVGMTLVADLIPPQNPARVAEIAAQLRPEAGFAETRVTNRVVWARLVAAEPKVAAELIQRGETALTKPLPVFSDAEYFAVDPKTGDVNVWYTKEFALNGILGNLVFAECLEGKGRFVARIAEILDVFSALKTWVIPYHDRKGRSFKGEIRRIELIGGIVAESMARTVDLLRDVLPPETVARAKQAVLEKELDVYLGIARDIKVAQKNDCSWLWSIYNWNAACNFYMVSAAVYLLDDPRQRAECIELAERSVPCYLKGFSKDGLSLEGPSYWDYGFGCYLTLAMQVRRASEGRVPFVTDFAEKVMASGFENRYNDLNAPGYGDSSSNELMGPPTSTWFRGSLVWPRFACPLADRRGLKSGLFMTTQTGFASDGLPQNVSYAVPYRYPLRTWYADSAQQLVCRPIAGQTNALYASMKGGHNGVGHNHNDIGTYTIAVDGYELVCDPGCKAYDQDTFTAKRYEENTRNSYGHPVPFVAGTMQSAGEKFAAQVVDASFTDEQDSLTLDLKGAYACDTIDRLVRSLSYRRNQGQVVVTDVVKLKAPGAFESPIITFGTVTPKGEGLYEIVYQGGRCRVMCRVQATGGKLVTKSESLSFIGKKNDPRARGVPTRFAFAFAEPITEASITFTYWIPKADEAVPAESACVLSAADFGFSPVGEPAVNAAALQKALDGGQRTVLVTEPGVYRLSRTIFLDDDTTLDCAEGVVFEKAKKYANVFANRGAFGPYRNHDITLKGVTIQVKGFEAVPGADSPAQGLRGQIGFYGIDRLKILNVRLEDFNKSQYAIQVVDFDDFLIDGFVLRGNKDGIHLNCGKNFVIRNGRLRTYDDGIAINAGEWPAACTPRMGSITDGLIENVVDEPGGHCNFARVITGAWREWYKGMPLQFRDIFTVGNDVYAVYPGKVSTNEVVSLMCPTHKQGVWTSPEGINFLHIQSDGAKRADIRRVTFRNIQMNCPRCFACSWEISGWARLLHPSLPRADYPVIDIRLENVVKTAPGPIIAGNADANIVLEGCRAEQGPLVSMRWSKEKTQCPKRTITVNGKSETYDTGTVMIR